MVVAVFGLGEGLDAEARIFRRHRGTVIVNTIGDVDGFGFGTDVVPIGGMLPGPPGPEDPAPFDAPDIDASGKVCALMPTWTHDITAELAELPAGSVIIAATLTVNMAGIELDKFQSLLMADTITFPLNLVPEMFRGEFQSAPITIPLNPGDLSDGLLQVTILKGITHLHCDDQFYDFSMLTVTVKTPRTLN